MLSEAKLAQSMNVPFKYFETVGSSNDIAQAWLREGASPLSVVIADEQREGRGRRGRVWYTPPGVALAVSIILKPKPEIASRASMVGALAVYDVCQQVGAEDIGIKWPNDVQIKGKKVSGILPEAVWDGDRLLGVILGIGFNVRNDLSGDLAGIATTLSRETKQTLDRAQLAGTLMQRIAYWYGLILTDDCYLAWKSRMTTLGQDVQITGQNLSIVGQAVDCDPDGTLLIKTADGSIQAVMAGDVSLRPQEQG